MMHDREKAIMILEGSYKNFVLRHNGEVFAVSELIKLLKAQQPRVMTLYEIWLRRDDEPLYLEYVLGDEKVLKPAIFQPDCSDDGRSDYFMCFVSAWRASGYYNGNEYGKTWRGWTSRPTNEQRRDTPWEK